jgi:predicted RNA binding protein YcfA (HicA-like mRNA interferase family)
MPPKIREVIRMLEREGWYLDRTRGSHRQFKHPARPGTVTVAGKPSDDIRPKMWKSVQRQAGLLRRRSDD